MVYPLLISLANIAPEIHSNVSLHMYLLLALLPIAKFTHKISHIQSLLQDRLTHQALNKILEPLKTAAHIGIMMDDPLGNLQYCYTPFAASKNFGNLFLHPPHTTSLTLTAIQKACDGCSPSDFKMFLKNSKTLFLNGVVEPFWVDWPLSCPSHFLHLEPLHHFYQFSWDHDIQWCIEVITAPEIDFHFSLLQTLVGYRVFEDGILKLKQVTGRDQQSMHHYIIGIIAGAAPH